MSYILIENFSGGLDSRKMAATAPPNTLLVGLDAVINRGAEVEKRKAFVLTHALPPGTHGMAVAGGALFVFGSDAPPAMPGGVTYQRLQHPDGVTAMVHVVDTEIFDGKLYVLAEFADGTTQHFYDGQLVAPWAYQSNKHFGVATVAAAAAKLAGLLDADDNVSASVSGAAITITGIADGPLTVSAGAKLGSDVTVETIQTGVAAVSGAKAVCSFDITGGAAGDAISSVKVNAVEVLGGGVAWADTAYATAQAVAAQINEFASTSDYSATVEWTGTTATGRIRVTTATETAAVNGSPLVLTKTAGLAVTNSGTFAGGKNPVPGLKHIARVALGGAFSADEAYYVRFKDSGTLDVTYGYSGNPEGSATALRAFGGKMYAVAGSVLYFSKLNDPAIWHTDELGAGLINMDTEAGTESLTGVDIYANYLAVFGSDSVQVWSMTPDETTNVRIQVLRNSGSIAPRSVVSYGGTDVYYLSQSGIRSIKARDVTIDAASVADIGTAIDTLVHARLAALPAETVARAVGLIDPVDARYWLAVGRRMFVFSYFPGSKISAWSEWALPDDLDAMATMDSRVYLRMGDALYLYGGVSGEEYDQTPVDLRIPYLTGGQPATYKNLRAIDIAGVGAWDITLYLDPNDEVTQTFHVGTVQDVTFTGPSVPVAGKTTHVSIRLVNNSNGYAALSQLALHFDDAESR